VSFTAVQLGIDAGFAAAGQIHRYGQHPAGSGGPARVPFKKNVDAVYQAEEAWSLLTNESRRGLIQARLAHLPEVLGPTDVMERAARAGDGNVNAQRTQARRTALRWFKRFVAAFALAHAALPFVLSDNISQCEPDSCRAELGATGASTTWLPL
jgi:hypothetical protein